MLNASIGVLPFVTNFSTKWKVVRLSVRFPIMIMFRVVRTALVNDKEVDLVAMQYWRKRVLPRS